jgi:hypothetical protein
MSTQRQIVQAQSHSVEWQIWGRGNKRKVYIDNVHATTDCPGTVTQRWMANLWTWGKKKANVAHFGAPGKRSQYTDQSTGWTIRDSNSSMGKRSYHLKMSRPTRWPTQPPIQWVPGSFSPGIKKPGRKADHSSPSYAEVKNKWSYTPLALYAFMTWPGTTLPFVLRGSFQSAIPVDY